MNEDLRGVIIVILLILSPIIFLGIEVMARRIIKEKVNVVLIELMTWVPLRKLALGVCEGFFLAVILAGIDDLKEDFKGTIGLYIVAIIGVIIFALCIKKYFARRYRCIIGCEYMNAKELKRSVENEIFRKIHNNIWESEHWLRLDLRFVPKSLVTRIFFTNTNGSNGMSAEIYLLNGVKFYEVGVTGLMDYNASVSADTCMCLPIGKMFGVSERGELPVELSYYKISKEEFKEYIKTHTVREIINSTELLDSAVERHKKVCKK